MLQNSSKLKFSLVSVLLMMWALCIISVNQSSFRVSPNYLAILLKLLKSTTPFPSLSQSQKTLFIPSRDFASPTLEATISKNSSNLMGLPTSLNPVIISKTILLLPFKPSSYKTFQISIGSMVPPPSSSKRSKVFLSSSQSFALTLSFHEVFLAVVFAALLPFIRYEFNYQAIKLKLNTQNKYSYKNEKNQISFFIRKLWIIKYEFYNFPIKQRLFLEHMSHQSINNFTVAIRLRKSQPNQQHIHRILSNEEIVIEPHIQQNSSYQYTSRSKKFNFDHIYENSSNTSIFSQLIKPKLNILKMNYNLMILAYGITGSGKTYTVFGNVANPQCSQVGISILSFKEVMEKVLPNYNFKFSYLQVYNQSVNDLLAEPKYDEQGKLMKPKSMNVLEDFQGRVQIPQLTKMKVTSFENILDYILQGNSLRASSATSFNKLSSRSHAILQLQCQDPQTMISSTLTIIDLAGSQKSFYTNADKKMKNTLQKQGSNINKSLLALGNCIQNLEKGQNHIPYRDSKLTRIIKEQLSGRSQNIMIACINPIPVQSQETINTLNYAAKASKIKLQIQKNEKANTHYQCDHCFKNIPWQKLASQIPSKYLKNTSSTVKSKSFIVPKVQESKIFHFEVHSIMNKMREQIEEQLENINSEVSHEVSVLFAENKSCQKDLKTTINQIIHYYEVQVARIMNSKQKGGKIENKTPPHLTLDVSIQTLQTEKQAILRDEKEKQGNIRKKISIKGNSNEFTQKQRTNSLLVKTQRMTRDLQEDKKVSNKQTIIKKLEMAQRKINQIQVSSFDPSF